MSILKDHYNACEERQDCDKCAKYQRLIKSTEKRLEADISPNNRSMLTALAIDFDGVLHNHKEPVDGRRMGGPIPGAKEAVEKLIHTFYIVIHSVWATESGRVTIAKWCDYYGIPYDEITNIKPKAKFYIDDNAIHHTSWQNTLQEIEKRL